MIAKVFVPPVEHPFTLNEAVPFLVVYVLGAVFVGWLIVKFYSYEEEA